MTRFGMAELRDKALAAVEEAASAAADRDQVVARTLALRFAFAFLANFSDGRDQFDGLWQAITRPPDGATAAEAFARRQDINSCMNGIYGELGVRRWEQRAPRARSVP
jgi:hypothetical protein